MGVPSRPRPEFAPGKGIVLEMYAVPHEGFTTVRFLANPIGTLIHLKNEKERIPCAGPGECRPDIHRHKVVWKGYAPAERWREHPYGDMVPCVLEITRSLNYLLGVEPLRGQVWQLYRAMNRYDKKEVSGHLVETCSPSDCPLAFDVRGVVQRCYMTCAIAFGLPDPLPPRELVEPTKGYVPPNAKEAQPTEAETAEGRRRAAELLREAIKPSPKPGVRYT